MPSDHEVFVERILRQKWDQGSLLTADEVQFVAGGLVTTAPPSGTPTGKAVLITQLCDLVASIASEPFAVCVPVIEWDSAKPLPGLNSNRFFVLDETRRLVAWQSVLIQFPKSRLPDREVDAAVPPERIRSFASWCARRWRRTPLPDVFVRTVGAALEAIVADLGSSGGALGATSCWRVQFHEAATTRIRLLAIYDEGLTTAKAFTAYTEEIGRRLPDAIAQFRARTEKRVGHPVDSYTIDAIEPLSLYELSVADALRCPMITYDHLSFAEDDADGDLLSRPALELREEDVF